MPIYEYICTSCEHEFDVFLASMAASDPGVCPKCGENTVQRKISVFSAGRPAVRSTPAAGGGCGRCGDPNGPCSM